MARIGHEEEGDRRRVVENGEVACARVAHVVDQAVNLEILGHLIGGAQIDGRVRRERSEGVDLVAANPGAGRVDEIGADLPLGRDGIIEAGLQAMFGDGAHMRARLDQDRRRTSRDGHRIIRRSQ